MGYFLSKKYWILKLKLLRLRLLGDSIKVGLAMSDKGFHRFNELRAKLAQLRGNKPTTYSDVVENAIACYCQCVEAQESGKKFFLEDAKGNRTPIELFEST
jgi:hypothetical protein